MKRVLIVDDDTIIRITLRALVDWEELGYTIAADAIHGQQALQILDEMPVDLVITDMKMPVLDGIGLLKAMSHRKETAKVLVLSGYDDFKMVRDAFRLGACDYMLKADLNGELMKELLIRLEAEGFQEPQLKAESMSKTELAVNRPSRILQDMAMGKREVDQELFKREFLIVQFEIEDFHKHSGRFGDNLEDGLIKPMFEFARQIPRVASRCILGTISHSRHVMLYQVQDILQYQENVVSACRQICSIWKNYLNLPVSAGISSLGSSPNEFLSKFEEAGEMLHLRFLKKKISISYPWENDIVSHQDVCAAGERYQALLHGLMVGDELLVEEENKKLYLDIYSADFNEAKKIILTLVCQLSWQFSENHDDISTVFAGEIDYYEKISRLGDIRSLELWVNNYFRWITDYIQHTHDRRQADFMIRAKRFIADNYANSELTLGSVAGYVGLNEKYFSSRFTREEGSTFSNYLTEVRIRKAKELMEKTDLKIYEISQNVGYNSVEHFTRVFKKNCKVSPGTYRK